MAPTEEEDEAKLKKDINDCLYGLIVMQRNNQYTTSLLTIHGGTKFHLYR